jgi:NAD(P)-dependent dehydrogenase (short-subunit alcohol dehydrogenase family)
MKDDEMWLRGTVVAVTGGAMGIGAATVRAFAACGAVPAVGDLDGTGARAVASPAGGEGYPLDVRDPDSFAEFVSRASEDLGPIGVLVNNAGIMPLGAFGAESSQLSDAVVDVNLRGVITGTRLVLPGMLERGRGHVVNMASYLARMPAAGAATYCATKFAVLGFSQSLHDELVGSGVSVTAVLPSAVRTGLVDGLRLGGWLPTVDPERIAAEIVRSCHTRRAVVRVPGWMRAYEVIEAVVPSRALSAGRRRLARDRIGGLDMRARAGYEARLGQLLEESGGAT